MKRRELGVIMKTCVAAFTAAVALTAMPTQVNAAAKKTMTVTTQKSLNAALKDKKVTTIVIKTSKDIDLSIPTGKYTSKSVEIIAPKASLINKATLKEMTVKSAKIVTEKADNNKIKITDKGLRIIVSKGADNSKISIGAKDAKVTVVADGKVSSVAVNKKATVAIIGKTTKPVSVTSNAPETGLILSAKSNVALKETTSVTVKKDADIGKITACKNAILDVVKGAKVNLFNSIGNKSSVKIDADGTVNKVALQKKASVTITGDTTKPVEVDNNAAGTVVNLAAKAIVNSSASASVNALRNAIIEYVEATKTLMLNLHGGSTVKEVKAIQDILLNLSKGSEVNSLTGSKNVDIKVAEGAKLDSVKLVGKDVKANVNINGTIEKIQIDKKADVKIKGTTQTPVNVTLNAAGAALDLSTAANLTLNENAKVNVAAGAKVGSLTVAKDATLTVAPKATVEELVVKGSDAKIDVTANGTLGVLTIDAKANVLIKGITDKPVVVNANVESAKITTEVKTELQANANVDITLGAGAEGSKVVAGKDVNASVKNETKENVTITDSTGKENTVGSGSTGDTKPAPINPPVYVPSYRTYYVKDKGELTKALENASDGDYIVITNTIGSVEATESTGDALTEVEEAFGNYDITKAVTITSNNKDAVVYGTFTILTDGVTINKVRISNRTGGDDKEKNAINIVASKATITNNYISVVGIDGVADKVANGILIYPTSSNVDYVINGNTIEHFEGKEDGWNSTAILLSERLDLSARFGKGISANLVPDIEEVNSDSSTNLEWNYKDDEEIIKGNTFINCTNMYVHSDWNNGTGTEEHVYCYNVADTEIASLESSKQQDARLVIDSGTGAVSINQSRTFPSNVTVEVRSGQVVVDSNSTITINGSLIIGEGAILKINNGCKVIVKDIDNKGNIDNDGSLNYSKKGLKSLLEAASQYKYDGTVTENDVVLKAYEYKSKNVQITEKDNILQILLIYDETDPATIVEKFGDDMPRFLGAIYRSDGVNGIRVVNEIVFNGNTYVWKPDRKLQGSNWCQKGTDDLEKTLVSAIKAYFIKNSTTPITIKIGDIDVQFVISRVES